MVYIERYLKKTVLDKITKEDIEEFIKQQIEENKNLDYKCIDLYNNPTQLSRTIVAFANGDGGLIVLGVREINEKDKRGNIIRKIPGEITWGDGIFSKEQLENKLLSEISRPIPKMRIIPLSNDHGKKIFLIDVPESDVPPHQAGDKCYYRRENFQNRRMEHVEIEDMFGRRQKPTLKFISRYIKGDFSENKNVRIQFLIVNIGKAIAKLVNWSISFCNVERYNIHTPMLQDITGLRTCPSFQFSYPDEVFYPDETMFTRIGEIELIIKDGKKPVIGSFQIHAENMNPIYGIVQISQNDIKEYLRITKLNPTIPTLLDFNTTIMTNEEMIQFYQMMNI